MWNSVKNTFASKDKPVPESRAMPNSPQALGMAQPQMRMAQP